MQLFATGRMVRPGVVLFGLLTLVLLLSALLLPVAISFADGAVTDPLTTACQSGSVSTSSATCKSHTSDNPLTGTNGTLYKITTLVAGVAGVIAVIIIVLSGFRYVTAGGDSGKLSSAKNTLIGAVAGLIVIVLARALITFIVSKV